jgi:hypothetical protein
MSANFLQSAILRGLGWLAALAAAGALGAQDLAALAPDWKPRFTGVDVAELQAAEPRRLRGVALRIDLQAQGISFLATPANGDRAGETDAQLTSAFLEKHGLQAAINAAPFDIVHDQPGKPQDVHGLLVSEGKKVSKAASSPALVIDRDNRAWIEDPMSRVPESAWNAVGGFAVILRGGEPTGRGDDKLHPRTAAGVSKDGRWLYWVVVDGRQFGHSGGVSTGELAALFQRLGAWDAINLDGGGTSTLVVAGPDGKPQILNSPVHRGIPGQERLSACHLGVRALPLQDPATKDAPSPQN